MTSIFFLTSIFNHSIHSSIAVFYSEPQIHEKWKGRIETWQPRKRQRRRAKRNNSSSIRLKGTLNASPLVFVDLPGAAKRTYGLTRASLISRQRVLSVKNMA